MKNTLSLFALCAAAMAADPLGDWYGTLETPRGGLRLALHLVKSDAGLKATLDSIDQGAMGIAGGTVEVDGLRVSAEFPQVKGKFTGTANSEATELKGEWSQGPGTLPLVMTRTKFVIKDGVAVPLTPGERDFLISHLEKSRKEFLASIQGVNKEQWTFKPAPERWSIAECAEHLVATESTLFNMVTKQILKAPIKEGVSRKSQADDEKLIARITDRSWKANAPEMLVPSGKFETPETVEKAFNERRDTSVQFVKTTGEDLRGRSSGTMDGYQYLVLMSAHTLRHTAQLNEVKMDPKYPK
ncbi:MAG: DinB family protein [Acidobacteria bacterium]|nr:DinB family protein [Acidobacteriota bacterium]